MDFGDQLPPLPNPQRHEWARWNAFIHSSDPDRLAQEFSSRNVTFHQPLRDTDDRLRGFEIADPDGYVCFFGRPIDGLRSGLRTFYRRSAFIHAALLQTAEE
ncbi:MAG: hypothetical protein ACFB6S_09515 [Geminicoccaceae bacterium]